MNCQGWRARLSGPLWVALILVPTVACGSLDDSAESESPVAAATFPSDPPDGPPPVIGPAPSTYRPTAAGAPSTDIWIGTLAREGEKLSVGDLGNVTDRDGYDNQPSFAADGDTLYYVSVRDGLQSEVYRYVPATGTSQRVTETEASEFSPNSIPGQGAFSAVHELRGRQHLWRYDSQGAKLGAIFATAEPVGYHAWANQRLAALFILGDGETPATLQVGNAITGEFRTVAENPGRSIHRIPGSEAISFVRKVSADEWWIERLDPVGGESTRLVKTLEGSEDYAWTPRGEIIMGSGSKLHSWTPGGEWQELQDLSNDGVAGISRLAVSAEGATIAIVADREGS